ncbi:unnamed protein product, partial [Polarella glacialis]
PLKAEKAMLSGTVKMWNEEKGFGFIAPGDGGADILAHRSVLQTTDGLAKGDEVTYEVEYDEQKGKERAIKVCGGSGKRAGKGASGGGL